MTPGLRLAVLATSILAFANACDRRPSVSGHGGVAAAPSPGRADGSSTPPRVPPSLPIGCTVDGTPRTVAEHVSLDVGMQMLSSDGRIGLSWATADSLAAGAGVELDASGTVVQPLRGSATCNHAVRVTPALDSTPPGLLCDTVFVGGTSGFFVSCGAIADVFASDLHSLVPNWNATYWCRTVGGTRPFVIGLRASLRDRLAGPLRLWTARVDTTQRPAESVISIDVTTDRIRRMADSIVGRSTPNEWSLQMSRLDAIEAPQAVPLANGGWDLVYRFDHRLHVVRLDADLHATAPPVDIATLGGEPGAPKIASDGHDSFIVFADRTDTTAPYRLQAVRFVPGGPVEAPRALDTGGPGATQHEFAPAFVSVVDGGWLLVWTRGPLSASSAQGSQSVMARRFAATTLTPIGEAFTLVGGASDPTVVATRNGALVAVLAGTTLVDRTVQTVALRCP